MGADSCYLTCYHACYDTNSFALSWTVPKLQLFPNAVRSLLRHHSALVCRSSSLSTHLKWMTTAQLVSRCHSFGECSVIRVVTVAAVSGPSKRFPIVVSCLRCVINFKCQRQAVSCCSDVSCECSASGSGWLALTAVGTLNGRRWNAFFTEKALTEKQAFSVADREYSFIIWYFTVVNTEAFCFLHSI